MSRKGWISFRSYLVFTKKIGKLMSKSIKSYEKNSLCHRKMFQDFLLHHPLIAVILLHFAAVVTFVLHFVTVLKLRSYNVFMQ